MIREAKAKRKMPIPEEQTQRTNHPLPEPQAQRTGHLLPKMAKHPLPAARTKPELKPRRPSLTHQEPKAGTLQRMQP